MAEGLIGAAPVGQPGADSTSGQGTVAGGQQMVGGGQGQLSGQDANQPQVNYVTSEQLDAAMDRIERMFQSRSDKCRDQESDSRSGPCNACGNRSVRAAGTGPA